MTSNSSQALNPLYKSDAAVGSRDRHGVPEVVFYQVKHRFVDNEHSIPDESVDIMYYTLAIGHHTGIIDASEERLRCPLAVYQSLCEALPEGDVRYKLEAILRGGEVYIDKFSAPLIRSVIDEQLSSSGGERDGVSDGPDTLDAAFDYPVTTEDPREWLQVFDAMLALLKANPAASITGRRRGL